MLNRIVRVYWSLAVVLVLGCSACTVLKDVIWPTTVKCLTTPSAALVERVSAIVARDGLDNVFSAETLAALDNVAREFGPEAVVCVIKELIDAFTAPTGMQAPPDRLAAARRAQDFLNEHEIVVQETGQ
jgi:hypothetical protein